MHNRHLFSNALGRHRFADELVDYLINMGVEYIFGMPAESVNSLVHAASKRNEIQVVSTRHESAAALMAVGYARASGRLGVCFGTAGPGATNLVAGAYEAFVGRVPLLAISGQVPVDSIGRDSFQEINSEALFQPCTASSVQIQAPSQFERFARSCVRAVHESTACHVAIPGDVLYAPISARGLLVPKLSAPTLPSKEELRAVTEFLDSSDLAIVGSIASAYSDLLQELSTRLSCPIYDLDGGPITARDVLVVGRSSPLLKQRISGYANLVELTDRRFTARSMPYIRQIVCDVGATLEVLLDVSETSPPESSSSYQIFTDLDEPPASLAGIPGAAMPLAVGGALGSRARSVVRTDRAHLSQFVADLSTLVTVDADVVIECSDSPELLSGITNLGDAMSVRVDSELTSTPGPALIAAPRASALSGASAPQPGELSLAQHLCANVSAPVQISQFCAPLLPGFTGPGVQVSANAQAPSMSASALRKSGSPCTATVIATEAALLLQLNGIYDAALDSARILVTTVETRDWCLDTTRLLDEVTVARFVVDDPATAAAAVRQACVAATATGSGVVHLRVLPGALAAQWAPSGVGGGAPTGLRPTPPDQAALTDAITAVRGATRVAIVAGRGAAGCSDLLAELSELLGCAVHPTMGGDSMLDSPDLRAHGRVGGSGDLRAYHDVARADVLLLVGVSNRGSAFDLGATGRTIVVNVDPNAMLRLGERDVCVLGDAMATLETMIGALRTEMPYRARASRPRRRPRRRRITRRSLRAPLRASSLTRAINDELARFDGAATVCADVGVNTLWVYRYITSMTRSIWSASFGTMGFAVPAAITVAKNCGHTKLAVAVAGDGGTSVTLSQIQSAVGVGKPVVFVVVNNLALAAIKFESEIMGWPDRGSAIPDINFARYAASVGVDSRRVDTLGDFRATFAEAIGAARPYLIDARCVLNDAPIQAGQKNWRQVVGFFVAWSKEGRDARGTFWEVTRAVVRGKLYEKGFPE